MGIRLRLSGVRSTIANFDISLPITQDEQTHKAYAVDIYATPPRPHTLHLPTHRTGEHGYAAKIHSPRSWCRQDTSVHS